MTDEPQLDALREALERQDEQIATWAAAEEQAAEHRDWNMADRYRYLASGAASAVEAIRAALAAQLPAQEERLREALFVAYNDGYNDGKEGLRPRSKDAVLPFGALVGALGVESKEEGAGS